MINSRILEKLAIVTEEERQILTHGENINQNLYTESNGNIINSTKLLQIGKLITIRPHTRFIHFPQHTHDYIEVVYMCSGKTEHIINGNPITLNEGELLFLSPNAIQEIKRADKNDIAVNFIILPSFFDKMLQMFDQEQTPLKTFVIDCITRKNTSNSYLHFKVADILPIQNLVENLLYALIDDIPDKRNVNQTTMGLLLLQLMNHTDRVNVEQKSDALLLKILRYIEENYSTGSLSDLAEILHYDLYWLSRQIKRMTGKTYTELLQEKRLSQAAFLLKTTEINVSDIAILVGYDNISYFHRIFAKQFGLSPKKYRACK